MMFDSENDEPEGDVEKFSNLKRDESLESDGDGNVEGSVEQIIDEDNSSENGTNMEQKEDPMSMDDSSQSSDSDTESTSPNTEVRWGRYLYIFEEKLTYFRNKVFSKYKCIKQGCRNIFEHGEHRSFRNGLSSTFQPSCSLYSLV